ncbi:MAG TPA: hypothetical protein VFX39_09265 [Gemmatimonadaceae bacterium]|nr:hypothetical protein [Gemmatimonadaceae bacterium]
MTVEVPDAPSPSDVLQGLEARREKLQSQLRDVEQQRSQVVSDLRRATQGEGSRSEAVTKGLEARLAALDARVVSLDAEIAAADAAVAQAAAVPGAVIEVPPPPVIRHSGPDEDVVAIGGFFLTVLLMPIVIAYARRLWRRGAAAAVSLPAELMQRLVRIEQGMDAMAIEVERISEGQRFVTRVFTESTERKALGAQVPAGEGAEDSLRRV